MKLKELKEVPNSHIIAAMFIIPASAGLIPIVIGAFIKLFGL